MICRECVNLEELRVVVLQETTVSYYSSHFKYASGVECIRLNTHYRKLFPVLCLLPNRSVRFK